MMSVLFNINDAIRQQRTVLTGGCSELGLSKLFSIVFKPIIKIWR